MFIIKGILILLYYIVTKSFKGFFNTINSLIFILWLQWKSDIVKLRVFLSLYISHVNISWRWLDCAHHCDVFGFDYASVLRLLWAVLWHVLVYVYYHCASINCCLSCIFSSFGYVFSCRIYTWITPFEVWMCVKFWNDMNISFWIFLFRGN